MYKCQQMPRNLDEKLVDVEPSYRWLKSGDIEEKQKVQRPGN
jgi:hypothetical protein